MGGHALMRVAIALLRPVRLRAAMRRTALACAWGKARRRGFAGLTLRKSLREPARVRRPRLPLQMREMRMCEADGAAMQYREVRFVGGARFRFRARLRCRRVDLRGVCRRADRAHFS